MRKIKKALAVGMATAMTMSLAACSGGSSEAPAGTTAEENNNTSTSAADTDTTAAPVTKSDETITIDVFSPVANFSGEQKGWFADIAKEKFNVVFNVINDPDGSQITTRLQTGNLGDIVVFGSIDDNYKTAVEKGYLLNWNKDDLLATHGADIQNNFADALAYNASQNDGVVYGFTGDVALEGSTSEGGTLYTWDTRWDLYDQLGQPEVTDLDSFFDLMVKMKEICPTDENGKETYAVSMWPDWDGNMVMYVKAFATSYFGLDEWGIGLYDTRDGSFHGVAEENGPYYQSLKFLNKLYQNGLVDPNSKTQTYQKMSEKMLAGGVFFSLFNYAGSAVYNSVEHVEANTMMLPVIPSEATPLIYGTSTTGTGYQWTIGASTQYPELCMDIINWLSTPEGALTYWHGPEGKENGCWYYGEDGNLYLTDIGYEVQANRETSMAPIGYSGSFNDGSFQINTNTWSRSSINPESTTGESFLYTLWNSQQVDAQCEIEAKWREYSGETLGTAYLIHWPKVLVSPDTGIKMTNPSKKSDLYLKWNQVTEQIVSCTWDCVYAADDAEFEKLFSNLVKTIKDYGYDECVTYCEEKATTRHEMEEILAE